MLLRYMLRRVMFWSAFQHQAYEPITKCFIVLFIFNFFTLVWSQLHMSLYCVLLSLIQQSSVREGGGGTG